MFRAELHEPGAKVVLGKRYADTGYDQGVAVLRDLAATRPPPVLLPPSLRAISSLTIHPA